MKRTWRCRQASQTRDCDGRVRSDGHLLAVGSTGSCVSAASSTLTKSSARPAARTRTQQPGQRLPGDVKIGQYGRDRTRACSWRCVLFLRVRLDQGGVNIDHVHPRVGARRPRLSLASARASASRFRAASSIACRVRHAVATDATAEQRRLIDERDQSDMAVPPSATITARSTSTWPRS